LVEAQLAGIPCVGVDINPIAVLLSKVKTLRGDAASMQQEVKSFLGSIDGHLEHLKIQRTLYSRESEKALPSFSPQPAFIRRLYPPESLRMLAGLQARIRAVEDWRTRLLLDVAFLAVLRRSSYLAPNFKNDYVPRKMNPV